MKNERGLTFTELLICLFGISLLGVVAFPYLTTMQQSLQMRKEVSTLFFSLCRARVEAIKKNAPVVILTRQDGYTIFVDNGEQAGVAKDWIHQDGEPILVDKTLPSGILITRHFSKQRSRFLPRPGTKAGTIELADMHGRHIQIIVNVAGRIRVNMI